MRKQEVEVLCSSIEEGTIISGLGRKFPGLLVQGDTLNHLFELVVSINEKGVSHGDEALAAEITKLRNIIGKMLMQYEGALTAHAISLPYNPPIALRLEA
jgi:hypothetical protein